MKGDCRMVITEQAKADIFSSFYGKVLGYLKKQTGNTDVAEDLCSEVFLKVYEKLDGFDESKASLSTWIFTITRNKLTDYYRTKRDMSEIPETYADDSDIENNICSAEALEILADALESLEERQRDIIILRFYSGLTLKEISKKLGISYAYVKVLQNKAFSEMRKFFG